jgi:hypothetical protein
MKKGCLSEEIFEEFSHEESHYKWRSFQRTTPAPLYNWGARFHQEDKNTLFCRTLTKKLTVRILLSDDFMQHFFYKLTS